MRYLFLVLVTIISFSPRPAKARAYFEPYVGYGFSSYKASYTTLGQPSSTNSDGKGVGYGAKLGLADNTFAIGADYLGESSSSKSSSSTGRNIGAFFQLQISKTFKLGASYYPSATLSSGGLDETGTAFKAEIGHALFSRVFINLDYIARSYKKVNSSLLTSFNATMTGAMLNLSFALGAE